MQVTSTNKIDLTTPAKALAYLEALPAGQIVDLLLPLDSPLATPSHAIRAATRISAHNWVAKHGRSLWRADSLCVAVRAVMAKNEAKAASRPSIRSSIRGRWSAYIGQTKVKDFGLNGIAARQWINTQQGNADPAIALSTIEEMATKLVASYRDCFATLRRLGFTGDARRSHPLYIQANYTHGQIELLAQLYPFLRAWTATGWAGNEGDSN